MRDALRRRGLPWSGKREVLLAQLTLAARKQIVQAMGGESRLAQHAALAVDKLSDHKVKQQLAALAPKDMQMPAARTSFRELRELLHRMVVNRWVEEAMKVGPPGGEEVAWPAGDGAEAEAAVAAAAAAVAAEGAVPAPEYWASGAVAVPGPRDAGTLRGWVEDVYRPQPVAGLQREQPAEQQGNAEDGTAMPAVHEAFIFGPAEDPVLALALLVGGTTVPQRDSALAAARMAVHYLQSDAFHGTLPAHQLDRGPGVGRQAVATRIFYAPASSSGQLQHPQHQVPGQQGQQGFVPLTWEQLFGCSASELDLLLASPELGPPPPASLEDIASEADVVLPLGVSPSLGGAGEVAADSSAAKLLGSLPVPQAASLAADSVLLIERLQGLGYSTAPLRRLDLSACRELAGGSGQALEEAGVFAEVAAWMTSQQLDANVGRVAVRAESGGAVLGAIVAQGTADVLQAALALMEEQGVGSVVLEAVVPGAVHVTVTVLGGPGGPVALPPTELGYYDLEDDIIASQLQFERFLAVQEVGAAGRRSRLSLRPGPSPGAHVHVCLWAQNPSAESYARTRPPRVLPAEAPDCGTAGGGAAAAAAASAGAACSGCRGSMGREWTPLSTSCCVTTWCTQVSSLAKE